MSILGSLPPAAQEGIIESLSPEEQRHYGVRPHMFATTATTAATTAAATAPRAKPSPAPRDRIQGDLGVANIPQTSWQPPEQGGGV
ncbi:hypothetical protein GCM10029964_115480 [Kibdelosporangium lantanae]